MRIVLTRVSTVSRRVHQRVHQLRLHHRQPGPLRGPVGHVDQGRAVVISELARGVVAQVAGDVDVGVGRAHGVEQEVPGSPADCDPAYDGVRVAGDAHSVGGLGQGVGHGLGEVLQRRLVDRADPADPGLGDARLCCLGLGELEDVVRRLLVGVGGQHRGHDGGTTTARQHRLDPHLVDHLDVADRAAGRVGALERPEPAFTDRGECAVVVVADLARTGPGDGAADMVGLLRRDEHDQLVHRRPGGAGERCQVGEPERVAQCLGDPVDGPVRVGVGGQQRAPGPGEGADRPSLRRGGREPVDRLQEQGVVHHDQVGTPIGRLDGHLGGRVDREQHLAHRGGRVACDQADGVPGVGGLGRVPPVDQVDDLAQGRHVVRVATAVGRCGG